MPCAQRAIDLRSGDGLVLAWLEDDFHHFGIELCHDGKNVTAVSARTERYPRDTCAGATGILQDLVGTPLQERSTALGQHTDMRRHCTHMYDLLGLAIAHAACGRNHRRYDAVIPDRVGRPGVQDDHPIAGRTSPRLYRDGQLVMAWEVEGNDITGPADYAGISMGRGFRAWTESLDLERAEAAHVLRRATLIALGRHVDLQALPAGAAAVTAGICHTFQPEVARHSSRMIASTRDYSDNPEGLLADIDSGTAI